MPKKCFFFFFSAKYGSFDINLNNRLIANYLCERRFFMWKLSLIKTIFFFTFFVYKFSCVKTISYIYIYIYIFFFFLKFWKNVKVVFCKDDFHLKFLLKIIFSKDDFQLSSSCKCKNNQNLSLRKTIFNRLILGYVWPKNYKTCIFWQIWPINMLILSWVQASFSFFQQDLDEFL